ncbi:MAG: DCC1-like thiol-disulfide oxidoreductase family protein, partial [Bacteroidota bacterium]
GTLVKTFWQSTIINGRSFLTHDLAERQKRSKLLIHIFYFITLVTSIQVFASPSQFPEWNSILDSARLFAPIWSVGFLPVEYWETCVQIILLSFLTCSFLGVVWWDKSRLVRVAVFLSMFFYVSLISSFGKIDHVTHMMMLSLFLLIFLPNEDQTDAAKAEYLKVIFGIQTLVLLSYFTSGFFKFYGILDQELAGLNSALSPDSMAQNLSKTSFAHSKDYFFSSFVLDNSSFVFSLLLIVGYCVELFSIYIIFKPQLHKIWGLLLIGLHAGILLSVGPNFHFQIITVGIFLLFSPFGEGHITSIFSTSFLANSKESMGAKKKNEFIVYYDGECLMCNRFLQFISKFALPSEMRICKIQSDRFQQVLADHPDLAAVDSIIVVEKREEGAFIRIKASAVLWVLAKMTKGHALLNFGHRLAPYLGNSIYDLVAANRTKTDPDNCPIPPEGIRKVLVN